MDRGIFYDSQAKEGIAVRESLPPIPNEIPQSRAGILNEDFRGVAICDLTI